MDLIKSGESKYEEYERLLIERDLLNKETVQIRTVYLQMFGEHINENYEIKLECIKCKKTISYYQNALNHGGEVDAKAMQEFLDREMAAYYATLNRMIRESREANESGMSTPYEAKRSKEIYGKLAKLIHPDLNPATDGSPKLQELWQRILIAYARNSVKELAELEVLVRKVLDDLGISGEKADIPDIEEKIEEVKKEIYDITNTEPYTLQYLIDDPGSARKKIEEIEADTAEYRKYLQELKDVIARMLASGGLHIYVE